MGRIKQRGKSGAAKAYVTRSAAVKKLQCSLADFRRLCILKGIFPREPRNRKKANKGSSAPTSFYYAKDIAYLAHEPVLQKLREHKAFAKKLSRALGRGEWSSAKSLEENKPVYQLDHIIKERYPTFIDAVRDIDDALCLVSLFASLPSNARLPTSLIENCSRLFAEWQLYIIHTHALRKVFLSIKGVYFQAEVMDQNVTWLVPYQFTQNIPSDVDIRVMLTFLELYQTLLGFVFFKLYTDVGLVYPPPLDPKKDSSGAGVGAFHLQVVDKQHVVDGNPRREAKLDSKKVLAKDVRQTIKEIARVSTNDDNQILPMVVDDKTDTETGDDFIPQPSKSNPEKTSTLATLRTLSSLPETTATKLFDPYIFFLSREISRSLFEFIIRSFGGHVGWPATSGAGSPFDESSDTITHVVIDRPLPAEESQPAQERERRRRRKYVQPQWIVDCVNAGKILPEIPYLQGATLPPHLSPFGEGPGAYVPVETARGVMDVSEGEEEEEPEDMEKVDASPGTAALDEVIKHAVGDDEQFRAAELHAETAGVDYRTFEKEVSKLTKKETAGADSDRAGEIEMNKMMMSRKQRKLYEKMKYSENKRVAERTKLEEKRKTLRKSRRRTEEV